MRKFRFRSPRFPVDIPIQVTRGGATRLGRCVEISADGLKFEGTGPLDPDSSGSIQIDYEGLSLALPFKSVYAGAKFEVVEFVLASQEQKRSVSLLISAISSPKPCKSLVRVG
jgi:hypothetical protein